MFTRYFNLLRSGDVFVEYIHESNYLEKHYPDATEPKAVLLAGLIKGLNIKIEEPVPERKAVMLKIPKELPLALKLKMRPLVWKC